MTWQPRNLLAGTPVTVHFQSCGLLPKKPMNPLATRFDDYLTGVTGGDKPSAAILVLAEVIGSALTASPVPALPPPESPDLLTVAQAAAKMNLSSRTVYELCLRGRLRPVKLDERIYIPLAEIPRYQRNKHQETNP